MVQVIVFLGPRRARASFRSDPRRDETRFLLILPPSLSLSSAEGVLSAIDNVQESVLVLVLLVNRRHEGSCWEGGVSE